MKKKILLPAIFAIAILTVGILSSTSVSAQDSVYPPIIERIADKFNLNKDDVRSVFEEVHNERAAGRYAGFVERLDDLVAEGKLTGEQKQALMDKHDEMQKKMEELASLNRTERAGKLKEIRDEYKAWAESQGIDLSIIRPFGHGFGKGGPGMWMGMNN